MAQSVSFTHNDPEDLEKKLISSAQAGGTLFVVTESVFSMEGDFAPLQSMSDLCEKYNAYLVVDEAHATGVVGNKGEGLVQQLGLQLKCFTSIHTFGKGCGTHGAIILGSRELKSYLVNFARSFIYTTALPEASIAAIQASYTLFPGMHNERENLKRLILHFQSAQLPYKVLKSTTPIQVVILPGNEEVKRVANQLQAEGLDVRAILYPTVPKRSERLRIVLHSFNTIDQLNQLIGLLEG